MPLRNALKKKKKSPQTNNTGKAELLIPWEPAVYLGTSAGLPAHRHPGARRSEVWSSPVDATPGQAESWGQGENTDGCQPTPETQPILFPRLLGEETGYQMQRENKP